MNRRNGRVAFLITILVIFVFAAPIGPMPGFFIGGHATPVPAEWPDTSKLDEISLKLPGTIPRVVIIWLVKVDGTLFVVGSKSSGWVQRIGDRGPVEMRMQGNTYALDAVAVTQNLEQVITAYQDKYRPNYPDIVAGFPSLEDAQGQFGVYRLMSRRQ